MPILFACAADAFAAHPLLTEDTATQGAGKSELELGNAWTRDGGERAYEFGPQLSYGVLPNLDGIVRPTWNALRTAGDGATTARGAGDTAVDVKWRFYEAGAVSVATRVGIDAPTGDAARGLGVGKPTYHVLAAVSVDAAPLALHANLGYTHARSDALTRGDLFHASTAAVMTVGAGWQLLLYDIAVDTNPERVQSTPLGVVRIGAIYTVRQGCDVDFGYQVRLNDAAPSRVLVAGLTLRW
ncbi:MAG TPA: transporter [Casimicrobiaceae bacterium]|nr:transporter [Casimicrobiaceae bacterium]